MQRHYYGLRARATPTMSEMLLTCKRECISCTPWQCQSWALLIHSHFSDRLGTHNLIEHRCQLLVTERQSLVSLLNINAEFSHHTPQHWVRWYRAAHPFTGKNFALLPHRTKKKVSQTSIKIISNETVSRYGGTKSTQTRIVARSSIRMIIQGAIPTLFIERVLLRKYVGCTLYYHSYSTPSYYPCFAPPSLLTVSFEMIFIQWTLY